MKVTKKDKEYDESLSNKGHEGNCMLETIKKANPELAEQLTKTYKLVKDFADKIPYTDLITPENLGTSLYSEAYKIIKNSNERLGGVEFSNDHYFGDRHGLTHLHGKAAESICALILSKYAEEHSDGRVKDFLVAYFQDMAKRDLLQLDSVPLENGVDSLRSSSTKHFVESVQTMFTPEELDGTIKALLNFNKQLDTAHDYPRSFEGRKEFSQKAGIAEDEDNSYLHDAYHYAGTFSGKGFGTSLVMAIKELGELNLKNKFKKAMADLLNICEPGLMSSIDTQKIDEEKKKTSKNILSELIISLKKSDSITFYSSIENAYREIDVFKENLSGEEKVFGEITSKMIENLALEIYRKLIKK